MLFFESNAYIHQNMLLTAIYLTILSFSQAQLSFNITLDNYTVQITNLYNFEKTDASVCKKLVVTDTFLYQLDTNATHSKMSRWTIPSPNPSVQYLKTYSFVIRDYDLLGNFSELLFGGSDNSLRLFPSLEPNSTNTTVSLGSGLTNRVFLTSNHMWVARNVMSVISLRKISRLNLTNQQISFSQNTGRVVFTPDMTKFIYISNRSRLSIYDANTLTLLAVVNQTMTNIGISLTNDIKFSADGQIAIIQTNNELSLIFLNMSDYSVMGRTYVNHSSINKVYFVGNGPILLAQIGTSNFYLINNNTGTMDIIPNITIDATSQVYSEGLSSFFTCKGQCLKGYKLQVFLTPNNNNTTNATNTTNTTNATNTTNQNNTINANNTTNTTNTNITNSTNSTNASILNNNQTVNTSILNTFSLQKGLIESQITQNLVYSLQKISPYTVNIVVASLSNPFTIYFLNFINFLTLSSSYALINMPLPQQTSNYLNFLYYQTGFNIFSSFVQTPFQQFSEEKVNKIYFIKLGLTTDLAVGQFSNIVMVFANIIFYKLLLCGLSKLSQGNIFRRMLYQPQSQIINGQLITLILPVTAPWIYYFITGVRDRQSKANILGQYVLFCLVLMFAIAYFASLLSIQQQKKLKKEKDLSHQQLQKKLKTMKIIQQTAVQKKQICKHSKNDVSRKHKHNNKHKHGQKNRQNKSKKPQLQTNQTSILPPNSLDNKIPRHSKINKDKIKRASKQPHISHVNELKKYPIILQFSSHNKKSPPPSVSQQNGLNSPVVKQKKDRNSLIIRWNNKNQQHVPDLQLSVKNSVQNNPDSRQSQKKTIQLSKQQNKDIKKCKKADFCKPSKQLSIRLQKPFQIKPQPKKDSKQTFNRFHMFKNAQLLQTWYECFSNLLFPFLLILPNPFYALSILSVFCLIGVLIAARLKRFRVNKAILAFYPFVFNCCFFVFRYIDSNYALVIAQIICLAMLLMGSIHHVLFLLFVFVQNIWDLCKNCNKVQNSFQNENEVQIKNSKSQNDVSSDIKNIVDNQISFGQLSTKVSSNQIIKTNSFGSLNSFKVQKYHNCDQIIQIDQDKQDQENSEKIQKKLFQANHLTIAKKLNKVKQPKYTAIQVISFSNQLQTHQKTTH